MAHYDLMGPLSRELSPELRYTIIVCLPFLVIETILNRALIGESRYKFTNLVEFGSSFLYSLLLIFLVLVLHWELYGANLALFLTRGISVFATVFYVFRVYSPVFLIDWEVCYRSYYYGFRVWNGGMTVFMNMYL
ncbi:MAG: hypothetical protein ACK53L_28840, partial [Pirellulaceae bacterium]